MKGRTSEESRASFSTNPPEAAKTSVVATLNRAPSPVAKSRPIFNVEDLAARVRRITTTDEGKLQIVLEGGGLEDPPTAKRGDLRRARAPAQLVQCRDSWLDRARDGVWRRRWAERRRQRPHPALRSHERSQTRPSTVRGSKAARRGAPRFPRPRAHAQGPFRQSRRGRRPAPPPPRPRRVLEAGSEGGQGRAGQALARGRALEACRARPPATAREP